MTDPTPTPQQSAELMQAAQGEPDSWKRYCTHRCLLPEDHEGVHFHGYNLPPDKQLIEEARREIESQQQTITELSAENEKLNAQLDDVPRWAKAQEGIRIGELRRMVDALRAELISLSAEVEYRKRVDKKMQENADRRQAELISLREEKERKECCK